MFEAFQPNAFEFDSFQGDIGLLATAFQPCAFPVDAFQTEECAAALAFQPCAFPVDAFQTELCHVTPITPEALIWSYGAHGGGGASNGKPVTILERYDWRSINELYREDAKKRAELHAAILMADDEAAIAAIMTTIIDMEEML